MYTEKALSCLMLYVNLIERKLTLLVTTHLLRKSTFSMGQQVFKFVASQPFWNSSVLGHSSCSTARPNSQVWWCGKDANNDMTSKAEPY